ncbi:MAG TPA: tetratricopeptide repeat protein [Dongiaceae bacterium]|nr:tetratricopeptide repeat protein [Dongiaceae bacterium]
MISEAGLPSKSSGVFALFARRDFQVAALLLVAFLVYANALVNSFTMDDELYIFRNPHVTNLAPREWFLPNDTSHVFRPVTFATLSLNYALSKGSAFGYHLFNLPMHAAATLLLFLVCSKILEAQEGGTTIAFVAALLFAVHPIHTEAVASIIGRSELLAAAFVFAGGLQHLQDRPWLALASFLLALLSKESAIAFLPLAIAGDYARGKFKPLWRYAALFVLAACYLAVLWKVQGGRFGPAEISLLDNPLAGLPPALRIMNAVRIAWKYLALMAWPATLSCDYSFEQITVYGDWRHAVLPVIGALAVAAGWLWSIAARKRVLILAGALYFAGFAATSNILTRTGTIMGERLAYLPSAGFCLLLAAVWVWCAGKNARLAGAVLALAVVALAARSALRNRDWRDNYTLFSAAVQSAPKSAKTHANLAYAYLARNELSSARAELQTALRIYPEYPDTIETLGVVEARSGNQEEALRLFRQALAMSDRTNINYDYMTVNLAAALLDRGQEAEAETLLDKEIAEAPGYSRAWSNRAVLRFKRREFSLALQDAQAALGADPNNAQAKSVLNKLQQTAAFPEPHEGGLPRDLHPPADR